MKLESTLRVRVSESMNQFLEKQAAAQDRPVSYVVRQILEAHRKRLEADTCEAR